MAVAPMSKVDYLEYQRCRFHSLGGFKVPKNKKGRQSIARAVARKRKSVDLGLEHGGDDDRGL